MDNHDYGEVRDEQHSVNYRYSYDYVQMFDSICIIKLSASQNIALARLGKAKRGERIGVQGKSIE